MFSLTAKRKDVIRWHGVDIKVNLSFDNVLLLFDLFTNDEISQHMKLDIAAEMLVYDIEILKALEPKRRLELTMDILKEKLGMKFDDPVNKEPADIMEVEIPFYDFEEDAEYIFASFLMDYGVNLIEEQGKLSWEEFIVLFKNLSDETPMKQAIKYRTCEVPKKTKDNGDEVRHIRKMKEKYMLKKAQPIIEAKQQAIHQKQLELRKEQMRKKRGVK